MSTVTRNWPSTPLRLIQQMAGGSGRKKPALVQRGLGMAGPGLVIKQMETWLPMWLDGRRAAAKQLADPACWGGPMPRQSFEALDSVLKTHKGTAGLGHGSVNPKATWAAAVRLAGTLHRSAHGLRGEPGQTAVLGAHDGCAAQAFWGHRTLGLAVSPLRVLSRLRRPIAQKWEIDHNTDYFCGCQGR